MADITFARSEVPVAFADAAKEIQLQIIDAGTAMYNECDSAIRGQIKDADYEKYTELGRQQKKEELKPMIDSFQGKINSLTTITCQYEKDIKDKDANFKELLREKVTESEHIIKYHLQQQFQLDLQAERNRMHEEKMKELDTISKQHSNDEKKLVELETTLNFINSQGNTVSILVEENKGLKEQLKSLQEVKQTPNSQHLGAVGEEDVLSILNEALCDMKVKITDIHSRGHEADVIVDVINSKNQTINFKVDGKNSNKDGARIQTTECDKIKEDVDGRAECCFGILIAHRGKIDGGIKHLDIEKSPKNKYITYLCWLGMTRQQKIDSFKNVVKILIEFVSLNDNNQEQQDRLKTQFSYLKKKELSHIKDAGKLADSLKKAWDEATKHYNKMLKVSQSTEYVDSDSESDEEKPPSQRGRGRGRGGRGRGT